MYRQGNKLMYCCNNLLIIGYAQVKDNNPETGAKCLKKQHQSDLTRNWTMRLSTHSFPQRTTSPTCQVRPFSGISADQFLLKTNL